MVVAPFAAWLVKHLPARVLGTAAGGLIVVTNARTLLLWAEVPSAATDKTTSRNRSSHRVSGYQALNIASFALKNTVLQ